FTQDDSGNYNSVRFQPTSGIPYRAVTTAWLPSNLDVFEQRTEFVFMVLRWFDKPEDRIELRVTNTDISISNDYPQLGSGYVIKVTVQNTGGSTGNVLVRFLDGSTQIGSDSISVSPGGLTTAEIIWVPLFAGQRTIHVLLDPIAEVPEIFEWSNNNASRQIYVYFFWDNMEFGAGKWSHSSTITLINGEGPLEYFGTTAVSVNIEKDWDYTASKYIENCTDPGFYHTFDKATWLQEPAGATTTSRKPLDVVFAIDSSGSMAWDASGNNLPGTYTNPASRWYNARVATIGFIQELTDVDRAIIFTFNNGADFAPLISPANYLYMTATNKQTLINALNGFTNVAGGTPFYDTLGKSVEYAVNNALNVNPTLPNLLSLDRMEFVIGLGDGQSNRDDEWTPNCNWGTTMTDNQWTNGGVNVNGMKGILNAPPIIYTIGVSGIPHDPAYPSAGDDPSWSRTSPAVTYPEEYDMWHCADSSPIILDSAGGKYGESAPGVDNVGHYYFTNDPTQLESVFQNILESIIIQLEGEEQTRSSLPGPSTMATTTYTYAAITSPSATHRAYYCDVDAMPPTGGNLNSQTEATTTEYGQIATSNNVRWTTPNPGNGDEVFMWSEFQIAESPATITQINFNFDGQCNQATDFGIWATNGAWAQVGIVVSAAADTDAVFTRSVSGAGCAAYIIGGVLTWGVYVDYSFDISRIDLLSVDIIWNSSPYIVNTVPANAATNIALTDNIVITFNKEINPTTFSYSVTPDPGGWSTAWNGGFTAVTLSHSNFNESTSYTVTVLSAEDTSSNALIADVIPNPWTFTTTGPPVITMTTPANGAVNVALTSTVVVTFSKAMNTASVTYTCLPLVTVWSVVWSAGNTVATYSHTNSFASNTPYTFRITGGNDGTDPLEAGVIPNPWTFTTAIEIPPTITNTVPVSGATGVALTQLVIVTFSEAMNTGSVGYSISPNPGGLAIAWNNPTNTIATISHNAFTTGGVLYTVTITGLDTTGNALATGAVPNPWSFRTEDYIQPTIIATTQSEGST
ncbi:MAG: Ig-like domain-containing protein, partial [Candidatus Thermoplasmatota archaeon]|nr:Ig-like domain-containing protein [Candidatus Thermoplasmatota archaeon]